MAGYQKFIVQLVVTREHEYEVMARTNEEAVSIAEGLYEDGELGAMGNPTVETADAMPESDIEQIETEYSLDDDDLIYIG